MFKASKKTLLEKRVKIFKVNIIDTRIMSGTSIANFEHISHIIILLLPLNSNK